MVAFTVHYNLGKPSGAVGGDLVDIAVENTNMDTIDTALFNHDTTLTGHTNNIATHTGQLASKFCSVSRGMTQAIATGALTAISFDTEVADTDTMFAPTSTDVTIKTAGVYIISGQITWDISNVGYRWLELLRNRTGVDTVKEFILPPAAAISTVQNGLWILDCAVNDIIRLKGQQTSGGNLNAGGKLEVLKMAG